jgi:hypothetical protein
MRGVQVDRALETDFEPVTIMLLDVTHAVLRQTEFLQCTAHKEWIAELIEITLFEGGEIKLDPPPVVHLSSAPTSPLLIKVTGPCR